VISLLKKNKKIDARIIRQVRKLFFISSLKRSIIRQFGQSFKYVLNILKLPFNARNESMLITFQGPDGSGKTSAIESFLSSNFQSEIFPNYMLMHTRPKIIPPLGRVFKAFKKKKDPRDFNLRSTSKLGYIRSNVYPLYYLIDFLFLHLIKLIYFKRGGTIIILDRYFYEYMYQQEFSHCNKPMLRFLSKIIPKPDINFIFKASAKVIHLRKDELSESEIHRQIRSLKSVFSTVNNSIWIDTETKKIIEVAGEVAFTIASNQKKL
jgi:thymidylate kinase